MLYLSSVWYRLRIYSELGNYTYHWYDTDCVYIHYWKLHLSLIWYRLHIYSELGSYTYHWYDTDCVYIQYWEAILIIGMIQIVYIFRTRKLNLSLVWYRLRIYSVLGSYTYHWYDTDCVYIQYWEALLIIGMIQIAYIFSTGKLYLSLVWYRLRIYSVLGSYTYQWYDTDYVYIQN